MREISKFWDWSLLTPNDINFSYDIIIFNIDLFRLFTYGIFVEMSSLLKSNGIYLLTQLSVTLCPPVVKVGRIVQRVVLMLHGQFLTYLNKSQWESECPWQSNCSRPSDCNLCGNELSSQIKWNLPSNSALSDSLSSSRESQQDCSVCRADAAWSISRISESKWVRKWSLLKKGNDCYQNFLPVLPLSLTGEEYGIPLKSIPFPSFFYPSPNKKEKLMLI